MAVKDQVILLHRKNPHWSDIDIASALNCDPAYVRATARRNHLRIARRAGLGTRAEVAVALSKAVDALLLVEQAQSPTPSLRNRANTMAARAMAGFERLQGWRHV